MNPAPNAPRLASEGRAALSGLALFGALVVAGLALTAGWERPAVHAGGTLPFDTDRDGLPDAAENVIGTSPILPDTDGDGFSDAVEIAEQTQPLNADSFPESSTEPLVSVGLSARGEGGKVMLTVSVQSDDGDMADTILILEIFALGRNAQVPLSRLLPYSNITEVPTAAGGTLWTLDISLPGNHVSNLGTVTWAAAVGKVGDPRLHQAASIRFEQIDGVTTWVRGGPTLPSELELNPTVSLALANGDGGYIHEPIPPEGVGSIPIGWAPTLVCFQTTRVVGTNGPWVIHEVIDAECAEGWDSFCAPSCPLTRGQTFETVDIGTLIGG